VGTRNVRSVGMALVVVVAVLAASCGAAAPTALAIVTAAVGKTTASHTARYTMTMTTSSSSTSMPATSLSASGAIDLTNGSGTTDLSLDLAGQRVTMHELLVAGTVYTDISALKSLAGGLAAGAFPAGVKWLKVSGLGRSSSQGPGNGAGELQLLREVSPAVTKVGTATIRGARTSEYAASIDPRRSAAKEKVGPTLRKLIDAGLEALGTKPVPVHAWIDSSGRLRRMTLTTRPVSAAGIGSFTEHMTFEYYDFGTAVHVVAPPASETYDLTKLVGSEFSSLSGLTG
jgi:hypothetical protein